MRVSHERTARVTPLSAAERLRAFIAGGGHRKSRAGIWNASSARKPKSKAQ